MAARPGLSEDVREELVGLRPLGEIKELPAGAHLFDEGAEAVAENDQGYVTSSCYSPSCESVLALGFLKNGRARHGERVRLVDHLRGVDTICEVQDPVQFDADGGRMRD